MNCFVTRPELGCYGLIFRGNANISINVCTFAAVIWFENLRIIN